MSKFTVWCPEYFHEFEDGRSFDTYSAADAARKWAKEDDAYSAEYAIASGREFTVMVRDEDGQDSSFVVSGEAEPVYYAREIAAKAKGDA